MSHLVAFPEDMYQAIAKYAAALGQTAEDVIFAWGKAIKEQVVDEQLEEAVYNPDDDPLAKYLGAGEAIITKDDPWAGFHGAFTASTSDLIERHDEYLADEYLDDHRSK